MPARHSDALCMSGVVVVGWLLWIFPSFVCRYNRSFLAYPIQSCWIQNLGFQITTKFNRSIAIILLACILLLLLIFCLGFLCVLAHVKIIINIIATRKQCSASDLLFNSQRSLIVVYFVVVYIFLYFIIMLYRFFFMVKPGIYLQISLKSRIATCLFSVLLVRCVHSSYYTKLGSKQVGRVEWLARKRYFQHWTT